MEPFRQKGSSMASWSTFIFKSAYTVTSSSTRSDFQSGTGSGAMMGSGAGAGITAGSGSMSVVGSGNGSMQGVGGGWLGAKSGLELAMSSSEGQMINSSLLFTSTLSTNMPKDPPPPRSISVLKKNSICWLGMFLSMAAGLSWFKLVLSWSWSGLRWSWAGASCLGPAHNQLKPAPDQLRTSSYPSYNQLRNSFNQLITN